MIDRSTSPRALKMVRSYSQTISHKLYYINTKARSLNYAINRILSTPDDSESVNDATLLYRLLNEFYSAYRVKNHHGSKIRQSISIVQLVQGVPNILNLTVLYNYN